MRHFLPLLIVLLLLPAAASAADESYEVRSIRLTDGRTLVAQVLESTAGGMRLRLPQGLTLVPYADLAEIGVVDASEYDTQAPLRIGIAPATPPAEQLAGGVDAMMGRAVGVMPDSSVVDADAWRAEIGADGDPLGDCAGDLGCLQPLARSLGADLVIIPQLVADRLSLMVVVPSSGEAVGIATAALSIAEGELNASASADNVIVALFTALSLEPEINLSEAIAEAFPAAAAVAAADADSAPAPEVVAGAGETADPDPETETTEPVAAADPKPAATGRVMDPRRARSIGLGMLPVPGISSASLGDVPGFVIGLVGTIGLSWAAVYVTGRTARTADAFWAPTILLPYAINVAFNQITGAVSWKRVGGQPAASVSIRYRRPRVGATVAPVLNGERPAPTGASVLVVGTF
ncbi:MAG: hypothetical protein GY898_19140 [Proteobacteria bacterium]|nr:hypothetical protein [Pseudomonadota bacterium]